MLQVTNSQLQEIANTSFGKVYTSPLSSWVIRTALIGIVTLVSTKLGFTFSDAETQGWVDLAITLSFLGAVIWVRVKSQGASIKTVEQAVQEYLPMLMTQSPLVRQRLLGLLEKNQPAVFKALTIQQPDLIKPSS